MRYLTSMKAAMMLAQLEEADDETLVIWGTDAKRENRGRYIGILVVHMVAVTVLAYYALWRRSKILYT